MNQKYTIEEKQSIYQRYKNGESVTSITIESGITRSTIYIWIQQFSDNKKRSKKIGTKLPAA